jgi:NAD(P)H dehydrogenase (quinone)
MRVLLLDAFPTDSPDRAVFDAAMATLGDGGHDVDHRVLAGGPFETFMSTEERAVYHEDSPLVTAETIEEAAGLKAADALLFCYPTTIFTTPAVLKSWFERVLVPGVAFVIDDKERVRPGMRNIRRLGAVTTTVHGAADTRRARDAGRRTTTWNVRLSCHPLCRRTFVSVEAGSPDTSKVRRALARW